MFFYSFNHSYCKYVFTQQNVLEQLNSIAKASIIFQELRYLARVEYNLGDLHVIRRKILVSSANSSDSE